MKPPAPAFLRSLPRSLHRRLPPWPAVAMATLVGVTGTALALALSLTPPAGAHSGGGTITVEAAHPSGQSIHYIVLLTWDNDGHPAEGATVTATPVGPDGASLTPVTLAPSGAGDGRYSGVVEFPEAGAWTVRFTSIDPTGSVDQPQEVAEATTTTTAPGDEAGTATTEGGFAPAEDGTGASADADAGNGPAAAEPEDDDSGLPIPLVVGAVVVAIGGVATALLTVRRYRTAGDGAAATTDDADGKAGATDSSTATDGGANADAEAGGGPAAGATPDDGAGPRPESR